MGTGSKQTHIYNKPEVILKKKPEFDNDRFVAISRKMDNNVSSSLPTLATYTYTQVVIWERMKVESIIS